MAEATQRLETCFSWQNAEAYWVGPNKSHPNRLIHKSIAVCLKGDSCGIPSQNYRLRSFNLRVVKSRSIYKIDGVGILTQWVEFEGDSCSVFIVHASWNSALERPVWSMRSTVLVDRSCERGWLTIRVPEVVEQVFGPGPYIKGAV